ncbi:MAG: MATE family efflux transporter [Acidimicrobiia bacterium]|nr:MAG: MATE family efflux transporter [Acidimicrobiia bacterium]
MSRLTAFRRHPRDRAIAALAIPALGTLAIDPLVSIVDTAWIGRLGTVPLAALAIGSAIFAAVFSIFNFVHAAITPLVAGEVGRGDVKRAGAIATGAVLLAVALGLVVAAAMAFLAEPISRLFGSDQQVSIEAVTYLRIRFLALPSVLVAMVGHGVYRGHSDTRTPLIVAVGMNVVNLVLDPILIFGFDLGVAGAAWATVVAQSLAALWFLVLIFGIHRRRLGTRVGSQSLDSLGLGRILSAGWPMMIRSAALLITIAATTVAASRIGTQQVAAHQIALQVWLFLSFVLDSLAVAATATVGTDMGTRNIRSARDVSNRLLALGLMTGVLLAGMLIVLRPVIIATFTTDPGVQSGVVSVFAFVVLLQPVSALVYVWDGIGIGASAFRFLAASMVLAAIVSIVTIMVFGDTLIGVWSGIAVLTFTRLAALAWWYWTGALSSSRDPFPESQAA